MTREDFTNKQMQLSMQAGTNQRYHQSRAHIWSWWDRGFRIAVGIFAVLGSSFAVVTATTSERGFQIASWVISGIAALLAVLLNVLPFGEWSALHLDLFRRWSDLREDIDALTYDMKGDITDDLVLRLARIESKVHRICGAEPGCNDAVFKHCYAEEKRSRQKVPVEVVC